MLEVMAFENGLSTQLIKTKPTVSEYEFEPTQSPQQVLVLSLRMMPFLKSYIKHHFPHSLICIY